MDEARQYLKHGKALCGKVFGGFVDTFNWLVDFATNLQGDADVNEGNGHVYFDRSDAAHPVIRCKGCSSGGSSGGGSETTVTVITGISFEIVKKDNVEKLNAVLTKKNLTITGTAVAVDDETVEVFGLSDQIVVTSEYYSTTDLKFTNERKNIKVIGAPTNATSQIPFIAIKHTDHS